MKRYSSLVGIGVMVLVGLGISAVRRGSQHFDEFPYRGETYKLARTYSSWEEYEGAPMLAPEALAAAQKAVESKPVTPIYKSRSDLAQGVGDLSFPGFGSGQFGDRAAADGSMLSGHSIEVPQSDRERVVVYRGVGDTWTLIDDFVNAAGKSIHRVDEADGKLTYRDFGGAVVVTRDPGVK
ncbi:MAG: hypothetical protein K2Y21_15210 [Phycisphaerales bacterium]|nr:hypothetical protein [Phycisphaerales bacterium]